MLTPLAPADGDAVLPLADAREHLRLTASDVAFDLQVSAARADAIDLIERHSGHALQRRQFTFQADRFGALMRIPVKPLGSVDAITYLDRAGLPAEIAAGNWSLVGSNLFPAAGSTWPLITPDRANVRVTVTAGYASADAIPPALLAAVKLAMTAMFQNRSDPDVSAALRMADRFRRRTL